jgi:hypothetical protein
MEPRDRLTVNVRDVIGNRPDGRGDGSPTLDGWSRSAAEQAG